MDAHQQTQLGRLLRDRGRVRRLGAGIVTYQEAGSTNELALEWARRGAPHGSLVLAESQTAGRGRWQREWSSARGGLYYTMILRALDDEGLRMSLLPVAASLAATEAIREVAGVEAKIRWPNDLLVERRKVGGILCESSYSGSRLEFVVAGFGINVNQTQEDFPEELVAVATSLRGVTGGMHDPLLVAACLTERLEHWWERFIEDPPSIVLRWDELAFGQRQTRVKVRHKEGHEFEATTSGMAKDGGLRVRLADGRIETLYTEEIVFFRTLDT
jgi:BirA family transcriptional regulator, biotin operon repressor / biotin---[acetyl-CoA-carboxylase] ligase